MTKLRKIDFKTETKFTCGGKEFEVIEDPGFVRYRIMIKIMLELGFSATFEDIFNNNQKAIDAYNKHDYFNMAIILYKIQEGIKNLEQKDDPALRLCTLFIVEKGEDLTKCTESDMKAKIDCWAEELEVIPFFYLGISLIPGWMKAYQLVSLNGLVEEKEKKPEK